MITTILSIVMLVLCVLAYIFFGYYQKHIAPKKNSQNRSNKMSANEFTNVRDISGSTIFTNDGNAISVFLITPVNVDLMTKRDKTDFVKDVSSCISAIKTPYKLLSVSQPVDISPYVEQLQELKRNASDKQKSVITEEISFMNELVSAGTMVEKHFYLVTWDKADNEYKQSRDDFIKCWNESKDIDTKLLNEQELISLCNYIFNPSAADEAKLQLNDVPPILENS